jgi:hypothetical protein
MMGIEFAGWTIDKKRIALSTPLRSGNADAVCLGTSGAKRYLVTLSTRHAEGFEAMRRQLRFDVAGVAPLVYIGPSDEGCPFPDALVEEIVSGVEAKPRASEDEVRALGGAVARVLAGVHAAGGMPEQLTHHQLTAPGDVFALAASLWFLAKGTHPFGDDTMEIVNNLLRNEVGAWTGSEELGAALRACLAPAPAERPSAAELARLLLRA